MHPPVDPWGSPLEPEPDPTQIEPSSPTPMYGRAAVPPNWQRFTAEQPELARTARRRRERADTRELGRRLLSGRADRVRSDAPRTPMPHVSWQRVTLASRRTMFDGWGFTAAGLLVLFCGWGVWAASDGSGTSIPPVVSLLFVIAVGVLIFALLRLLSRIVIEGMWRRRRPHARWAHFLTGVFLAAVGVSYLLHAAFLTEGVTWLREQMQRL